MQENHNDQPIELTYPVEIQFTDPNETNNSNQPMEQDSNREQTTGSSIQRENITFTLVEQHSSSDKENNGRPIKAEEDIGNSNSESQVFPTSVTPPERTNERADQSTDDGSRTVQECTGFRPPLRQILEERRPICHRSFDHLRTVDKVFTYLTSISGIRATQPEKQRLAKLWILLKDDRFVLALISQARKKLNWHCAELLEVYTNIACYESPSRHSFLSSYQVTDGF